MGNVARLANGQPVGKSSFGEIRPWFIARSEVEGKIKSIGPDAPNREERIRTYQSMLDSDAVNG